ncbi:MAG: MBL fold metallo-hydrolase [Anaerolineaceae bacterium]|nr:MBL fold metallo-hydrolase [Anaerolineaceae bacterium]
MNTIRQLTPFLWVVPSRFYYNSGVIISQNKAAIIDAGMADDEVAAIREFIQEKPAKLEALVLTHSHPDHILGPRHFPDISLYAHSDFAQEATRVQEQLVSTFNNWAQQENFNLVVPFTLPIPSYSLGNDSNFRIGEIVFQVYHFPGHAPDMIALYHPESRLLWASDMLSDAVIPIVQHSVIEYEKSLSRVAEMDIAIQIPGHGDPSTDAVEVKKRLDEDRTYLAELQQRVKLAVDAGKSLEETEAECESMNFKEREWNLEGHKRNISWVWNEFNNPRSAMTNLQ